MSYMQHHFNVEIAKKFGMDVAVFLDHIVFWIVKNMANDMHYHDGTYWTYNSADALKAYFPYWSEWQIRKVIKDCEKYGLINLGNYNCKKYDRTQWYSLTEDACKLLNLTILRKPQMHLAKTTNASCENHTPIPDTNPVTNTSRERERKKRVPLPDDFKPNAEAEALAKQKGVDIAKVFFKFRHYVKSEGWRRLDWQASFLKWIEDEKKIEPKEKPNTEIRSTVGWFNDNH